ncbi:MAG: TlyA family RNA methyltransferase [Acidimicrobiales bacterium]|nr:MAG: TlyA family RNA methyltransferase [Acidimicrobiales bacterium]
MALQSWGVWPAAVYSMARRAPKYRTGLPLKDRKNTATRRRLDLAMVRRDLAPSRTQAREFIAAGRVTVNGAPAMKASRLVADGEPVVVAGPPAKFVSRAGRKLEHALDTFDITVTNRLALDAGASTGGFTDCLIQRGASHVYAIDVGTNQLHERVRALPTVTSLENCDIRSVSIDTFRDDPAAAGGFDLVVGDLSFISTRGLLEHLSTLLAPGGDMVVLIKPQFEAGRQEVSRGRGVITDRDVWVAVLHAFIDEATRVSLEVVDLALSPITGGKGNVEFLGHLRRSDILESVNETPEAT